MIRRDQSYYYAISRTSATLLQTEIESNKKLPLELIKRAHPTASRASNISTAIPQIIYQNIL